MLKPSQFSWKQPSCFFSVAYLFCRSPNEFSQYESLGLLSPPLYLFLLAFSLWMFRYLKKRMMSSANARYNSSLWSLLMPSPSLKLACLRMLSSVLVKRFGLMLSPCLTPLSMFISIGQLKSFISVVLLLLICLMILIYWSCIPWDFSVFRMALLQCQGKNGNLG